MLFRGNHMFLMTLHPQWGGVATMSRLLLIQRTLHTLESFPQRLEILVRLIVATTQPPMCQDAHLTDHCNLLVDQAHK